MDWSIWDWLWVLEKLSFIVTGALMSILIISVLRNMRDT